MVLVIIFNSQFVVNIPNSPLSERVKLAGQSIICRLWKLQMLGRPPAALSSFPVVNLKEPLNWLLKLSEVSYATCLSSALSKLITQWQTIYTRVARPKQLLTPEWNTLLFMFCYIFPSWLNSTL